MRFPKYLFFVLITTLGFYSCGNDELKNQRQSLFDDQGLVEVYNAAHRGDTAILLGYAESENAAYRMAYARLMGSVLPERSPEELEDLLTDPIPYVRLYAAFAVGQIGNEKSLSALEKAFKKSTIPEIKAELLEAIGKCADVNAMEFLVSHNPNTAIEEAGKIWGIYRGMLAGKLQEKDLPVVVAHLNSGESETRLAAANVLSRQRQFDLEPFSKEILQKAFEEENSDIKATLGYALNGTSAAGAFSEEILKTSDDPLLRSVALLILPEPDKKISLLENSLISGSPWEAMTAAKRIAQIDSFTPTPSTIAAARTTSIPEVAAVVSQSLLNSDQAKGEEFYNQAWKRMDNPVKRAVLLGVWTNFDDGLDTLERYIFDDGPLGTAAADAYISGMQKFPEWGESFSDYAKRIYQEGLLSQSVVFSLSLSNSGKADSISEELLLQALDSFSRPEYIEAYQAIASALKEIHGIEKPPLEIEHPPIDWEMVKSLGESPSLILFINGSEYEIKLVPEDAPSSVSRLANLAEEGFYDGTYFHRIVPGFVSQGGGPRGDGYGSDDHILRSEFSPLKYGRGVVGLASAGKDTESCQFFITHMPTPHLDGRYTIVGASEDDFSDIETGAQIDSVRVFSSRAEM
jgi:cyclophilin family peptidyl-prolyl cis-trans isomerase